MYTPCSVTIIGIPYRHLAATAGSAPSPLVTACITSARTGGCENGRSACSSSCSATTVSPRVGTIRSWPVSPGAPGQLVGAVVALGRISGQRCRHASASRRTADSADRAARRFRVCA